ncbi:hypothetical protein MBANPS3_011213 [Mucor bainieri]
MSTLVSAAPAPTTPPLLELSPSQKSLVKAWWRKVNSNLSSEKANRHALYTEGIFRLSGNAKRISMLQMVFDTRTDDYGLHLNWDDYTVHDASNVMRRFLNHLPEPLISLHYQALFKTALDAEFPSLESKIDAFQNLIERLPIAHQYLLLYLLDLLYLFSQCVEYTRMDSSSLATAFSPVIFPDPSHATNPAGYKESQRVLEFLILHQCRFFMPNTSQHDIERILTYPTNYEKLTASSSSPLISLPSFNRQRRHSATTNSSYERSKTPYSLPYTSSSASDLFSFNKSSLTNTTIGSTSSATLPSSTSSSPLPTTLKRSKTAPSSKRSNKFGDSDSSSSSIASKFTLGDANNSYTSLNQNNRNLGRWKSIKRVVKEEDEQLRPLSPPGTSTTPLSI